MKKRQHSSTDFRNNINLIANLFQIFGFSIKTLLSSFIPISMLLLKKFDINIPVFLIENYIYIIIIYCVIVFAVNSYLIPLYKRKILNIPDEESKPSVLVNLICLLLTAISIIYQFVTPSGIDAEESTTIPINYERNDDIPECPCEPDVEFVYEYIENTLTPTEQTVNELVPRTHKEIIPIEVWRGLSDKELYYCRNGIFAYEHAIFKSNFYEVFPWYSGTVDIKNFDWSVFNKYQVENIKNIRAVEKERKESSQ